MNTRGRWGLPATPAEREYARRHGATWAQYNGLPLATRQALDAELRAHIAALPDPQAAPSGYRYNRVGLLERDTP
jgi:hypothetical protein